MEIIEGLLLGLERAKLNLTAALNYLERQPGNHFQMCLALRHSIASIDGVCRQSKTGQAHDPR